MKKYLFLLLCLTFAVNFAVNSNADQQKIEFLAKQYLELMKNYDPYRNNHPVIWGGAIELSAIARMYKINIIVISDNDEKSFIGNDGDNTPEITLQLKDHRYSYIHNGNEVNVPNEGNGMFYAVLEAIKAKGINIEPKNIADLRAQVVDFLQKNIEYMLAIEEIIIENEKVDGIHTVEELVNNNNHFEQVSLSSVISLSSNTDQDFDFNQAFLSSSSNQDLMFDSMDSDWRSDDSDHSDSRGGK